MIETYDKIYEGANQDIAFILAYNVKNHNEITMTTLYIILIF